jgi:citrate synthase
VPRPGHGTAFDVIVPVLRGDRLMGAGHRVYRVTDPRTDAARRAVASLGRNTGHLHHAAPIEPAALAVPARRKPARSLQTNLEFHTARLLKGLDIPRDAFASGFAVARVTG